MTHAAADQSSPRVRLTILLVVVTCLFAALFARLWFLEVIDAPKAQAAAADNGVRVIYTPAPRGEILDRNGNVLVDNVNEPVIEVSRQIALQNPQMVTRLAPLLGMTVIQLDKAINNVQYSPYAPVPVLVDATADQILYIQENQLLFPGAQATTMSVRHYTQMGLAAANIVGYLGQITQTQLDKVKGRGYQAGDEIGQAGIEEEYESYLRGTPGVTKVQVDSQGNVLTTLSSSPAVPGDNIVLSINGKVQEAAEAALSQGMTAAQHTYDPVTQRHFEAPAASAVVEDPQNGQIIALATDPTYPVQDFVGGISEVEYQALLNNPSDPLLDRSIDGQYAPGSTFKLITATAGLESGLITPYSIFDDTGSIHVGTELVHNNNYEAYGKIDLSQAITVSSDNYFNTIGVNLWYGRNTLGEDYLQNVAEDDYGLGSPTGIDLPNEDPGKIPTPQSYVKDHQEDPAVFTQSQWYPGNSDQVAIGQDEVLVTPLQLANAYATFADGGTLRQPRVAMKAETPTGQLVRTFTSPVVHTFTLQPAWRQAMIQGFEGVTGNPNGTAYLDFTGTPLASIDIAGKTGTAQVNAPRQDTSVFTSFAPGANPRYVVDSFVEDAGYGASVAGPVVRQIYDNLFGLPPQPITYSATGSGGQT